ncbi:MAG: methyltransferase [Candidatus Cloacimonadaceae bacterium]|nr:methyltransferase [Candidatus Cloacimonadota bacterium]MDY0111337.1 methyltransferase [Candidatus Syntrophosphaera sp.]
MTNTALSLFADCPPQQVLDLGTGCGIIAISLAMARPSWKIMGLDIQPHLVELAKYNAELCSLKTEFQVADLCTFTAETPYTLILSNPPWQPLGRGKISPYPAKYISRFEVMCSMTDILSFLKRNLAIEGDALLLYPAFRIPELQALISKSSLDIMDLIECAGFRNHFICHIHYKGHKK